MIEIEGATSTVPPADRRRGVTVGLVAAVAALGSAELVAAADRRFASPVTQVGNRVIDAAPPWLKTFAIERFGTNDKAVLVGTVLVAIAILAALIGLLSRRHRGVAMAAVGLFGVVGVVASVLGVGGLAAAVPSVIGGLVGVLTLWKLAGIAWATPTTPGSTSEAPKPAVAEGSDATAAWETPTVRSKPQLEHLGRRGFFAVAGGVAVASAGAAATGRWLRTRFDAAVDRAKVVLPSARRPLAPPDATRYQAPADGVTPFYTSNRDFYRVDTALEVPQVALEGWTLKVDGLVDRALEFTYEQLIARDLVEADMTLTCVSNEVGGNLAGTARWLGVPLEELLDEAGVSADADQVIGRSVDGYTCGFPVDAVDGRTAMVAVGMNGEPLPVVHGFPARLLVAGLYGYVSATKWLTQIELGRFDRFDQYWVPRGWNARAPIKTFSRIDTPAALSTARAGRHPIAGVAWAQTRGIERVEVRVDDGDWTDAELRPALNRETWIQWVLPWDFAPGSHTIECRATDGTGVVQTSERASPRPDGATGWHSIVALMT